MGYLVVKRKIGQSVILGDDVVTVTVLKVKGKWVSLGITAPEEIDITRDDVGKGNRPEASIPHVVDSGNDGGEGE